MKEDASKKISIVFLFFAVVMIVFFTFQKPQSSYEMSLSIRDWLAGHGIDIEYSTLRTNAHLVEYFILGLALTMFTKMRGCKWYVPFVTGCGIGVLDEMIKLLLPGREFGVGDLIRDFVGVFVAVFCGYLLSRRYLE